MTRAFELGVGSYFIKPMEIHALKGVLEGIVAYWRSRHRPAIIQGSIDPRGDGR